MNNDTPQDNLGDAKRTGRSKGALRTWLVRASLAVAAVVVGLLGAGKVYLTRVENHALRISSTGTSLNAFLKTLVDALKARDVPGLLDLYSPGYADHRDGAWADRLESDRDGVQVFGWSVSPSGRFTRTEVGAQVQWLLDRTGAIESGKFKITSIESLDPDGSAVIRANLWTRGRMPEDTTRENWATLRLWVRPVRQSWQITSKQLLAGRTVLGHAKGFTDVTKTAGITFRSGHNPMLNEPEWLPKKFGIMKYATAGVAAADYDNDRLCDIFFSDGARPRLFRNRGDGTFEDATTSAGLPDDLVAVSVALLVDLDNDGDRELFLGRSTGRNLLYRNNGDGTFTDVTQGANVQGYWVATAAAADYDNDGKVDLYLGRYLDPRKDLPATSFYTRNGQGNSLLHNDGELRFRDVTEAAGVRDGGLTLGLCWGDIDADGDQDVYVANDFGRNALFRNDGGGKFTDIALPSGTLDIGYGMSSAFADIDNDGDLDLYVAGVHSGQRWFGNAATLQRFLLTSIQEGTIFSDFPLYREIFTLMGDDWQKLGERVIRGNSLFLNNGDGTFKDVTEKAGANPQGWYWSSQIADLDNDGLQDVYAVNGWITGKTQDDL